MTSKGIQLTRDERERLRPLFEERAFSLLRNHGRISVTEAVEILAELEGSRPALNCHYGPLANSMLTELPNVVRMGPRDGYGLIGHVQEKLSLDDLVLRAAGEVRDDHIAPMGPRTSREVHAISGGQFKKICVAAGFAAQALLGDGAGTGDVTEEHLVWDTESGEWLILDVVSAHSDSTARAKYDRAKEPGDSDWNASLNDARRKVHVQNLKLLLDLSVTKGWISLAGTAFSPAGAKVPAPEWLPVRGVWDARYAENPLPNRKSDVSWGFRKLQLYATRLGFVRPENTDWNAVRLAIVAAHEEGTADNNVLNQSRTAFNYLIEQGLIQTKKWETRRGSRTGLASQAAVRAAVSHRDFSQWHTPDRGYAKALVENTYGVKGFNVFIGGDTTELEEHNLPPRRLARPTFDESLKHARRPPQYRHRPRTRRQELYMLSFHAGFLASRQGIDWTRCDLSTLIDPARLEEHIKARHGRIEVVDSHMSTLAKILAFVARPFLEAVALQQADSFEAQGKEAEAEAARQDANTFAEWSVKLLELQTKCSSTGPTARQEGIDNDGMTQEKVHAVWRAFTRDGISGWEKLGWIQAALIREIETTGYAILNKGKKGVLSIPDQLALLKEQANLPRKEWQFRPNLRWARLARNAVLFTLGRRVPLRPMNVTELLMGEWTGRMHGDTVVAPWLGSSMIAIRGKKTKSSRKFSAPFLLESDREDTGVMEMARMDLIQLYFTANGARDELRRLPEGFEPLDLERDALVETDAVFPAEARYRSDGAAAQQERIEAGLPWGEGAYGQVFRAALRKHSKLLKLDVASLEEVGGMGPHIVRHLFGSHHCDVTRANALGPARTAAMLHHKSTVVTERFYMATLAADISVRSSSAERTNSRLALCTSDRAKHLYALLVGVADRVISGEIPEDNLDSILEHMASMPPENQHPPAPIRQDAA